MECLDLLVSSKANFQLADNIGRLPLHYAVLDGHYQCTFTLVGIGSHVDAVDAEGCSPLHLSAAHDFSGKCVEYLLQHKGDPMLKDRRGFTPLHYAVVGKNLQALEHLLTNIAGKHMLYGQGMSSTTPLHLAVSIHFLPTSDRVVTITLPPGKKRQRGDSLSDNPSLPGP